MDYPKIACAMIVKATDDEAPLLANALASMNGYVDAFYFALNVPAGEKISKKVRSVAEQYCPPENIFVTDWTGDFAGTRNFIFGKVPKKYDWICWIDTDDTVENPDRLRDIVAIASKQVQGILLKYEYTHDEYGNSTVDLWVCRIVRNNGTFSWKSSFDDEQETVHETLCEVRTVAKVANDEIRVIHHSNPERQAASLERNLRLLSSMYNRQSAKGMVDPRILYYLGTHYFEAGAYNEAKQCLQDYMQLSGWAEERSEALAYLGDIYRSEGKSGQAKTAYLLSTGENPNSVRAYTELAEVEFKDRRYLQAIDWLDKALDCKKPKSTIVLFPMDNTYRVYMLLAQAHVNIGGKSLEEAYKYVKKALSLRPLDPDAQNARDLIERLVKMRDDTKAAMRLVNNLDKEAQNDKIIQLLDLLPADMQDNPAVLATRHQYMPPQVWPKQSIAIYVGPGPLGIWGPWSLEDGVSGSEEAVIQLSRKLAEKGWGVTVFATPGDRAGFDFIRPDTQTDAYVEWKQYWEFNPKDEYDVLIGWRSPWFFDGEFRARKQYLWLHDVIDKEEITEERLAKIDKVIFVSQYHADIYAGVVPKKKMFVSGNGIDPIQFEKYDAIARDPHKCVYTSAHERGLKVLYDIWPEVKEAVPEATLDVYYGWEGYDAINRDNPERMDWKATLVKQEKKLKKLGVIDHGRVGHDEIARAMSSAGVFSYPCVFPEVYCISLIKAQAAGTYPLTSDFAVLDEYNTVGKRVHLEIKDHATFKDEYKYALIKTLKTKVAFSNRKGSIRDSFSWDKTADGWNREMS